MMKLAAALVLLTATFSVPVSARQTDEEVRRAIIEDSIKSHVGACPCPESLDSAGRRCGERAAYRKVGGDKRPLCYPSDVSDKRVKEWRAR